MRKSAALIGALLGVPMAMPAFGAPETITGQLIDIGNYVAGNSPSEYTGVHARACSLEGFAVGLLVSGGKVYQVTGELAANSNAKLLPYMLAKTVTISGEVSTKNGRMIIVGSDIKMSN